MFKIKNDRDKSVRIRMEEAQAQEFREIPM